MQFVTVAEPYIKEHASMISMPKIGSKQDVVCMFEATWYFRVGTPISYVDKLNL